MLVVAAAAGLAIGWARGGEFGTLSRHDFRAFPLLLVAVLLDAAARIPGVAARSGPIVFGAAYITLLVVLLLNRRLPWLSLVLIGTALNTLVIIANGGRMPVSSQALRSAGGVAEAFRSGTDVFHVLAGPGTPLWMLGDIIGLDLRHMGWVVSPGDVLMALGIAGYLQWAMNDEQGDRPAPA
jgi:Family of unknown function (DUF5317)